MDLLTDFDRAHVLDKQRSTAQTVLSQLDAVVALLEETRNALASESGNLAKVKTAQIAQGIKRAQGKAMDATKELHSAVSKYAKAMDKDRRFKAAPDSTNMWNPRALDNPAKTKVLNRAIVLHLVREGRFDLARTFAAETQTELLENESSAHAGFADMFAALAAMRVYDLSPACEWAQRNSIALQAVDSPLLFSLIRLQFLKLLFGVPGTAIVGTREGALQYAQKNFEPFKEQHMKEIQKLMCALLYANNILGSPYKDLYSSNVWTDVSHMFTRDFCLLLHLPAESPLQTCVSVGVNALPTIMKMSSILKEQSGLEWSTEGELPVEIPLKDKQRFHSVFVCPVLKELGTVKNPPMMMVCGHVVCKESLLRLGKGNLGTKFKCPYCPSEGRGEQAMQIHF